MQSVRVPASEIIHLYRMDRAGQVRGVPWGAPVLIKLRDFHEYEDAQLVRQKIAACFAAFVRDADQQQVNEPSGGILDEKIEPGTIHVLPAGKDIEFGSPPTVGADYEPYATVTLRAIASGFGVTYECLTQDYSKVNYSSGRMGWIEFHRNIEHWRWNILIPHFCETVWTWFMEAAELVGRIDAQGMPKATWTPPRREMIDPTKETDAQITAVRGGLKSLSEVVRENGGDPARHFDALKADNDRFDKLGLKLDCDPRTTNKQGAFQGSPQQNETKAPSAGNDESGD